MKKNIIMIVLLLLMVSVAAAQEGNITKLQEGFLVTLPDGWELGSADETFSHEFWLDENVYMEVTLSELLDERVDIVEGSSAQEVLAAIYDEFDWDYDFENIDMVEIDTREIATLDFEDDDQMGTSSVIAYDNGDYAFVEFYTPEGELEVYAPTSLAIILSLYPVEVGPVDPAFFAGDESTAVSCQVYVEDAAEAALRVGPGENRGVFASLTPDMGQIMVMGQKIIEGAVWYQLLDAEDSTISARELWVAATDVVEVGDCAAVVDVDAPPVIQGQLNPPAANAAPAAPADNADAVPAAPADNADAAPATPAPVVGTTAPVVTGVNWVGSCADGMMPYISWTDADGDAVSLRVTQMDGEPFANLGISGYGEATVMHNFSCETGFVCGGLAFVDDAAGHTSEAFLLELDCQ